MNDVTYDELELLICLHFLMAASGITKEGVPFQVAWRCFTVAVQYFEESI